MDSKQSQGQFVFGLDIGTRSLVGTVGYMADGVFHVVAQCIKEHDTRSMLDGQIHDIDVVGNSIKSVREDLEKQLGRELKDVCIAAAGRVLKTVTVKAEMEFDEETAMDGELIYSLDMLGIEKAYEEFQKKIKVDTKFYCVGYTVVNYFLNDYPISNLEMHIAKRAAVELIATFLPDEVVDGLYKAVEIAGLQVANLTLEPIAAIHVAIPVMYRMLNIALVDVGAGTSDICVTKDGSIVAYGMIPMAGDELTEVIAKHCLVDFGTAEKIKTGVVKKRTVQYKDIMGITQKISKDEVLKITEPVVKKMTKEISDKIKYLNGGKPVAAIFVVGGGGKLPTFTEFLAKEQGIDRSRCALRGEEVLKEVDYQNGKPNRDPLFVTPIGICLNFYDAKNNFIFVNFNGERIKLYDNGHLLLVDAAIQAGFPNEGLFPKRGKELNFTVDGKSHMVRGELGEAAVITLNGDVVNMNTEIRGGDKIIVEESSAGADAHMELRKIPGFDTVLKVNVNGTDIELPRFAQVNGELQSGYYDIRNNDEIKMLDFYTVKQIAEFMDVILAKDMNIYVNNKLSTLEDKVYNNFSIIWTLEELSLSDVDIYGTGAEAESFSDLSADEEYRTGDAKAPEGVVRPSLEGGIESHLERSTSSSGTASQSGASRGGGLQQGGDPGLNGDTPKISPLARPDIEFKGSGDPGLNVEGSKISPLARPDIEFKGGNSVDSFLNRGDEEESSENPSNNPQSDHNGNGVHITSFLNSGNTLAVGTSGKTGADAGLGSSGNTGADAGLGFSEKTGADAAGGASRRSTSELREMRGDERPLDVIRELTEMNKNVNAPDLPYVPNMSPKGMDLHVRVNDQDITLKGKKDYIFVDIFDYIDFDLSKPKGKAVVTRINGKSAQYAGILNEGDNIEVYWEN